jgi:hypothetical protein
VARALAWREAEELEGRESFIFGVKLMVEGGIAHLAASCAVAHGPSSAHVVPSSAGGSFPTLLVGQ